jgi:hypothetical protein
MQDKKVIALIVLTVLAVISLIYGVTASPKSRANSAATAEGQVAIAPAQGAAKSVVSTGRRARRSQFKAWNGIIWNKVRPKAMIGDAIVVEGDTVGANKVVDIQQDRVILNDGTKDFELKIEK